jgi:hypothetical protein
MIHEVKGSNYHGPYTIRLRGPAGGFRLSKAQEAKVAKALCGVVGCTCGGRAQYGEGPEPRSARIIGVIVTGGSWEVDLVPSGHKQELGDAPIA